jgi:hypothetical protein
MLRRNSSTPLSVVAVGRPAVRGGIAAGERRLVGRAPAVLLMCSRPDSPDVAGRRIDDGASTRGGPAVHGDRGSLDGRHRRTQRAGHGRRQRICAECVLSSWFRQNDVALESRFVHHTWLAITTSRHLPLIVQLVGRQDMSRRRGVTGSCRRSRHPLRAAALRGGRELPRSTACPRADRRCRVMSLGQEAHRQLVEVVGALQRQHV